MLLLKLANKPNNGIMAKQTDDKKLIELTKQEFQSYYEEEITDTKACEIVDNFTGFARLLLVLDEKRQKVLQDMPEATPLNEKVSM